MHIVAEIGSFEEEIDIVAAGFDTDFITGTSHYYGCKLEAVSMASDKVLLQTLGRLAQLEVFGLQPGIGIHDFHLPSLLIEADKPVDLRTESSAFG